MSAIQRKAKASLRSGKEAKRPALRAVLKSGTPARKQAATKKSPKVAEVSRHAPKPKQKATTGEAKMEKPPLALSAERKEPHREAHSTARPKETKEKEKQAASKLKGIRIRLSAFDYSVLDEASMKIVDTAVRSGAVVHGPTPLPTKIRKFTVNRSTFVHKDARDQFEMRTHRRLIDLGETTFKTVDALQNLSLPSGVDIEIKMG